MSSSTSVVRAFRSYARELPKILWLPPIPSPQRLLVAFLFRSARLALWADALKPLPPHRLNLALRFSAERAKARIERIPRRFQDFIGTGSVGLIPLPPECRFASASRNALSFTIVFAIGCGAIAQRIGWREM